MKLDCCMAGCKQICLVVYRTHTMEFLLLQSPGFRGVLEAQGRGEPSHSFLHATRARGQLLAKVPPRPLRLALHTQTSQELWQQPGCFTDCSPRRRGGGFFLWRSLSVFSIYFLFLCIGFLIFCG